MKVACQAMSHLRRSTHIRGPLRRRLSAAKSKRGESRLPDAQQGGDSTSARTAFRGRCGATSTESISSEHFFWALSKLGIREQGLHARWQVDSICAFPGAQRRSAATSVAYLNESSPSVRRRYR